MQMHSSESLTIKVLEELASCYGVNLAGGPGIDGFGNSVHPYRMFTARAANSAMVASEMRDWIIIIPLAQRDKTGTSVGEKAVEVLKARKR